MQPTDPDRFSDRAWEAIVDSQEIARRYHHQNLEVEHVALSLLAREGSVCRVLEARNADVAELKRQLETFANRQPPSARTEQLYLGRGLDALLDRAEASRESWQDETISVEHLFLGFAEDERIGRRLLRGFRLDPQDIEATIKAFRNAREEVRQQEEAAAGSGERAAGRSSKRGAPPEADPLERFGRDLTAAAREGKLDPVIGRDVEIRRTIQVLSRRSKNNPVLIGEPGVGKTAIAEGLAQRIVNGDVPESLKDRRLIGLDMGSLIAGAKYRGEFEDRLRGVLHAVTHSDGQIVLFIDELQTVVGAGNAQGTMDASNILKPMLARGELRCIGATTLDEYRKHIEKDPALERRFQQVYIKQPSVEDAISILRGLKERYEVHHGVKITDSALVAAATLSDRYITERFLPDKAIDLVDEAAAQLKMEITSKPTELETIDRRILQLQMEMLSIKGEAARTDASSTFSARERSERIEEEIATLQERQQELSSRWQHEKQLIDDINALKEEEDRLRVQVEQAERAYDLDTAAELKYGRLGTLQEDRQAKEQQLRDLQTQGRALLREEVTEADVADVVANWTNIPVARLMASERQKLLELEGHLHQRVIGQSEAVSAVSAAIRRARAGMKDPGRPIGSFLFMGPTGVGKTELARAIAQFLFDSEEAMVRIDMSEYMEKHAVSRLVGAPPGYVGYEEGGQLSEQVRRRPYSVVLLDEVEKAHPDVFNVLLQVLDDGRITDSQGRTIDFRNTIVVMTSNIGGREVLKVGDRDDSNGSENELEDSDRDADPDANYEEMRKRVLQALRKHFRPEFLNRIDDLIIFHALRRAELRRIVDIQLQRIQKLLSDQKIAIELGDAAKDFIVAAGYDPIYGARPLKRAIQRELENPIATKILEGAFAEGDRIVVDCTDSQLLFGKQDTAIASTAGVAPEDGIVPPEDDASPEDEEPTDAAADASATRDPQAV
ncbi:ATP-dependent chaperone ClpB [Rubidibacter lacunae KORDI 51-2]|uniref:Chaperone protein ClpB n=1 Tax=Rubidibacter lacunae KORDI 51-2 TaxID=582515 RepID=U5DAF2_9CHRO|nr:ATP-dependent chaperone ClpB [Rubidibacter lacunae]ERN41548.1 ATP-dependent chaperone ClpB [Rubidibacter lacunae KORDI 51-2]